jgi:hypothetical protein
MGKTTRALLALALLLIAIPFFAVGASIESIVMSLKGYRYNSGWGRWEKK